MYHSVTFTNNSNVSKNTWDDWYLIPTSRPTIAMPKLKEKYIDLPGTSLALDLCEAVKKYPVYDNREGELEFLIDNGHAPIISISSDISSFFVGGIVTFTLEDDLFHYYRGRVTVKEISSGEHWTNVTLSYIAEPYKLRIFSTLDDWLWDPFNFNIGVFQKDIFYGIAVDGTVMLDISGERIVGRKPVCPDFIVSDSEDGITVSLYNRELGINVEETFANGRHSDGRFILSNIAENNSIRFIFAGEGSVSVDFRSGGL